MDIERVISLLSSPEYETLLDDVFLFRNALTKKQKEELWNQYEKLECFLYTPKFKGKWPMNLRMACFGKHWNAEDNEYYDKRVDVDPRETPPSVPDEIIDIATPFSLLTFPYHVPYWDICLMNEYEGESTLGVHQDKSESAAALKIGHPVVSFSLGAACEFAIGRYRKPEKTVELGDGDVLVFGGINRLAFHGVTKVLGDGKRLNFTLRKY